MTIIAFRYDSTLMFGQHRRHRRSVAQLLSSWFRAHAGKVATGLLERRLDQIRIRAVALN